MPSLEFLLEAHPPWRQRESSLMSNYVTKCLEEYDFKKISPEKERHFLVDFVHQSNVGEDLGTRTVKETNATLLEENSYQNLPENRKQIETTNTFRALNHMCQLHKEMDGTGLITVQQICDIHRILMRGLHCKAGEVRDSDVYTITNDGERYFYPSSYIVEDMLYSIIDQHNSHMIKLQQQDSSLTTTHDKLQYLVKSAAWLLFNFVDAHPFSDGNGRMCRLLAGYTMMVLNPFPVHPYHKNGPNCREDYIDAIVSCRRSTHREPSRLAALVLDALYDGWQTMAD